MKGGGGGCRVETSCSDVTSAAGRQDGREKLACATQPRGGGRVGRKLNAWEGKKRFCIKHTFICEECASCRVFNTYTYRLRQKVTATGLRLKQSYAENERCEEDSCRVV